MNRTSQSSPRVSVVIPAYNNAAYLACTLDSVLTQDFDDYEVVVADHSSSDATREILEVFATHPRVRILSSTPAGGGALANWNRVSQHARGDLLKLVCGDDLIAPSALARQVAALDANPRAVMVACRRDLIDAKGQPLLRNWGLRGLDGIVSGRDAMRAVVRAGSNLFGEPACVLFRRAALERAGGWDNAFPYLIDQATYCRILEQGDLVALQDPLACFRISASQWSVRLVREQAAQARHFHAALRDRHPGLLSRADLIIGNLRATAMAYTRRLVYLSMWRRL
ncbi:glycosyltransferase family 2 protein [Frateuria soli]|uniref:glycosyltransferase family 2 protein n=1 Tax=Frateuria soli TaxID=1542730 RepID=UPI001E54F968|nr:glycosyltransferase family A protein [Frateuria soli]UGB37560.1 glycosyltransferase family 2 protein [Frateuria soli]